jgi:hypothetical protein
MVVITVTSNIITVEVNMVAFVLGKATVDASVSKDAVNEVKVVTTAAC